MRRSFTQNIFHTLPKGKYADFRIIGFGANNPENQLIIIFYATKTHDEMERYITRTDETEKLKIDFVAEQQYARKKKQSL